MPVIIRRGSSPKETVGKLPDNKELIVWFGSLAEDRASEILRVLCEFAFEIRFFSQGNPELVHSRCFNL